MISFTDMESLNETWLDAKTIAKYFGVSEQWIQVLSAPRKPKEQRLTAHYFGRRKRFKLSEVEKYFAKRNNIT